jgi:hypothetical protein
MQLCPYRPDAGASLWLRDQTWAYSPLLSLPCFPCSFIFSPLGPGHSPTHAPSAEVAKKKKKKILFLTPAILLRPRICLRILFLPIDAVISLFSSYSLLSPLSDQSFMDSSKLSTAGSLLGLAS